MVLSSLISTSASANLIGTSSDVASSASAWATPVDKAFNLYEMTPTLYRSALPNGEGLSMLLRLKIRTVVSFIKEDDAVWLGDTLVKHVNIPLHADRVDDADVLRVLRVVQEAQAEGPVLMHCKHGRNRTGLMAAMYRVVVQDWSKEDALKEMQYGGYGSFEELTDATRYVEKADVTQLRLAMARGECNTTRFSSCYVRKWLTQF
ncbi:dual specificity protein phosphatase family protein [Pseudomonas sp. PDM25]|uniref:dual specificity protein phosphatase family protein n=1 Tax=Pseudomonas sp. PDM25 TaxID=2854772 RepID=UPI001C4668A2|nr:dual specificity protein phosphatase family protein [Pseudomonas sp. PDM25]